MAAGQKKKRLNAANVVSCDLLEQHKAKKKKKNMESPQDILSVRPHISLRWDDNQQKVVAKREQIGITWRDVAPFFDSVPRGMGLADIFAIPQEIFGIEIVTGVLSYEVWKTHLSESERNFLTQFLPRGTDVEHVVQQLLTGENFHFGNPFLKWGASLSSGNLHPDAVLGQERCFKANKKAYYSELQKYHNDILENLQRWKQRWESCADPEKDIVQKMWRSSRKHAENILFHNANESRPCSLEENLAATAESCSWVADEKECNSNKQRTLVKKSGKPQERKGLTKDRRGNSLVASERPIVLACSRKEEQPLLSIDGTKYMSYFKISRKQHQLVTRMKHSDDGIQSKSLNRVLGDIKNFQVQPYEAFEEDEQKKLHEHWLKLANRDLPEAFADWIGTQLKRQKCRMSLGQEMTEKLKPLMKENEGKDNPDDVLQEETENGESDRDSDLDTQSCEDDEEPVPHSTHSQPLQRIPSLNIHHEVNPVDMDSEEVSQDVFKPGVTPFPSDIIGNMNATEDTVERKISITSAKDIRPVIGMMDSYYRPTPTSHLCASADELSLRQPRPIEERPTHLIDLESDLREQDADEVLLHRSSIGVGSALHIDGDGSLFSSYPNQNRNELLQPFLKGEGMLQYYPHEHKQPGLQFQAANNLTLETSQLPGHFRELQQQMQQQRQMREREVYMQQVIQKKMYSNRGRYTIPGQELFSPVDVQDWPVDPLCISAPLQPHFNGGGLSSENWFLSEHQARGGWSDQGVSGVPDRLGNENNMNGSLFSILSECNNLQSRSPYGPMSEQHIPGSNFVGGGISRNSDVFPHPTHQPNYMGGREAIAAASATATLKGNNMSWMNSSHQNSVLHDPIEKPFLRPWNQ